MRKMLQNTTDSFVAHAIKSISHLKDPATTRWCLLSGGLKRWTLEYTIEGEERVLSPGGTSTLLEAGSLLLIKPGTPRNLGQDSECKKWVRYFCVLCRDRDGSADFWIGPKSIPGPCGSSSR